MVDVFSPNHVEFFAIFGKSNMSNLDKTLLETLASKFLESGVGQSGDGIVVIRAGENGCFFQTRHRSPVWLPPYYQPKIAEDQSHTASTKIIDQTGAGNAFLGAFTIGLLTTQDPYQAACYGAVGSSFALEQIGVPVLDRSNQGEELWNGSSPSLRLQDHISRTANSSQ